MRGCNNQENSNFHELSNNKHTERQKTKPNSHFIRNLRHISIVFLGSTLCETQELAFKLL